MHISMLAEINVNSELPVNKARIYKKTCSLHQKNINFAYFQDHHFNIDEPPITLKATVPIKQYSNNFLHNVKNNNHQQQYQKINQYKRLNSIMKKNNQIFYSRYIVVQNKKYICKTEPIQHGTDCFNTFRNYNQNRSATTIISKNIDIKSKIDLPSYLKNQNKYKIIKLEDYIMKAAVKALKNGCKTYEHQKKKQKKKKYHLLQEFNKKQLGIYKLSTSIGVEIHSKIYIQNNGENALKFKQYSQKIIFKNKPLQNNQNNFQAKRMQLLDKQKSIALIQRKAINKTIIKNRNKKYVNGMKLPNQQIQYQLKGWQTYY